MKIMNYYRPKKVLDRVYPEIDIEFIELEGVFGPEIIDELSTLWDIPKLHVHRFARRSILLSRF
jgi:hypothetical protein